jgi:hypothetical protein
MTNVSAGGCCILVEEPVAAALVVESSLVCRFRLPNDAYTYALPVEVRNQRSTYGGKATLVGLRFLYCEKRSVAAQLARIEKFLAEEQRRVLRSRKS